MVAPSGYVRVLVYVRVGWTVTDERNRENSSHVYQLEEGLLSPSGSTKRGAPL